MVGLGLRGREGGREAGCLDQLPGSLLNPNAHPYQRGRAESQSAASLSGQIVFAEDTGF